MFWVGSGLIALSFLAAFAWRIMHIREQLEVSQPKENDMQSVLLDTKMMNSKDFGVQKKKQKNNEMLGYRSSRCRLALLVSS